jgi:signal transduction histidine kinase
LIDTVAQQIAYLVRRRRAEADRRQLSEQLRHADRLATIGQLSAGVAHELNEPLGGILGFAQLMRKSPGLDSQLDRDLGRIEAAALHARGVVRKLMLFARQTPPGRDDVDLNRVVQEGLALLESRCAEAGIEVIRRLDPALPSISADYGQLHQILVNLAVNALQAMPSGGELTVETRSAGDHVRLIVSDTGHGMTEEVRRQVFDPFFTTKDVGEGTGLGLAVVHGIVSAHGGRIELESTVGKGSRFEVRLPQHAPVHGNEEYE